MNLNTALFEGNLADTPQLTHTTGSQIPVAEAVVLVNRSTQTGAGEWVDAEPTRYRIKAWRSLAKHLAELPKGATVLVAGTVITEAWTDKDNGQKRTANVINVDAIGASLRFATVTIRPASSTEPADV